MILLVFLLRRTSMERVHLARGIPPLGLFLRYEEEELLSAVFIAITEKEKN